MEEVLGPRDCVDKAGQRRQREPEFGAQVRVVYLGAHMGFYVNNTGGPRKGFSTREVEKQKLVSCCKISCVRQRTWTVTCETTGNLQRVSPAQRRVQSRFRRCPWWPHFRKPDQE